MKQPTEKEASDLLEASILAQLEASKKEFMKSARFEALRYAPNRKEDFNSKSGAMLTASEIKDEAEIIYQWLIKDL